VRKEETSKKVRWLKKIERESANDKMTQKEKE